MPDLSLNHEHHRPNGPNQLLGAKNSSLPSPATNRRRVGDTSASGKTDSCGWHSVLQIFGSSLCFIWGRRPHTPGIYRFGATMARLRSRPSAASRLRRSAPNGNPSCEEGRILPVPPLPQLSRRSGRVPAEPCPPLSYQSVQPNDVRTSRNIQRTASV
jgi:hypothetical protein